MKKEPKIRKTVMKMYNRIEIKMLKEACRKYGVDFKSIKEDLTMVGVPTKISACIYRLND